MKHFDIDEPNRIAQILQLLKNEEPAALARMIKTYPAIFSEPAPASRVDESLISAKRRQMGNMFKGGR